MVSLKREALPLARPKIHIETIDIKKVPMRLSNCTDRTPWSSLIVVAMLAFVEGVTAFIFVSSLYSHLKTASCAMRSTRRQHAVGLQLDSQTSERFYALVVGCFSAGTSGSGILYGAVSNRARNVRLPIIAGILLSIAGQAVYAASAWVQPQNGKWFVLCGRLLAGIGAGKKRAKWSFFLLSKCCS